MIITPQLVFMVLGVVGIVAAAILLAVALVYYIKNDIRGVEDDLAGRTRQRALASQVRTRTPKKPVAIEAVPAQDALVSEGVEPVAFGNAKQFMEDDLDTVVDAQLQKVSRQDIVSSDVMDVNGDTPTFTASAGDYYRDGMSKHNMKEADMPNKTPNGEEYQPTQVETVPTGNAPAFVITRSILAIHSDEIISAG